MDDGAYDVQPPPHPEHTVINTARSALCTAGFYVWGVFMATLMLPLLLLPRRWFRLSVQTWSAGNAVLLRLIGGITFKTRGLEHVPPGHTVIVASKHQSEWESNVFLHLLPDPVYIMKKELKFIPGYGAYSQKMGMIFIDRRGRAKALRQLIRDAERAMSSGRPLVIFPEGTRVDPGKRLPYRPGVAALYSALNVPVVPVAHNSGLYWPRKSFRKYPGTIVVQFLPPIPAGLERQVFMKRLEEAVEGATRDLILEAGGTTRTPVNDPDRPQAAASE